MKQFIFGVIFALIVGLLVVAGAAKFGMIPVNADAKPAQWEWLAAGLARHGYIEAHAPKVENPLPINDDTLIAGMQVYTMACADCHGKLDRKASEFGASLYPPAPNLIDHPVDDDPESETFFVTKHGIRHTGMPAWNGQLTDDQIWKVTAFLKRIPNLPPAVKQRWKDATGVDAPNGQEHKGWD